MISLFYLSGNTTGGWVTFTAHLVESLRAMGHPAEIYKIGNRTENKGRPFGYGLDYWNVDAESACRIARNNPTIITAVQKNYADSAAALLSHGAQAVLHDPTELRAGFAGAQPVNPWVIRRAVQAKVPGSVFIRHPYVRRPAPAKLPKKRGIVSVSRIDFDKHTDVILAANRLGAKVDIRGFENRLYTKFKIMPAFPEWEQSIAHYPRDIDAAYTLLLHAKGMVDMSLIKGDGGGTQYTFLEAWDAGTVPIIQNAWIRKGDDMRPGVNCFAATGPEQLALYCKQVAKETGVFSFDKDLKRHSPKVIVPQVLEWLHV